MVVSVTLSTTSVDVIGSKPSKYFYNQLSVYKSFITIKVLVKINQENIANFKLNNI